jgi:hypothetical protein
MFKVPLLSPESFVEKYFLEKVALADYENVEMSEMQKEADAVLLFTYFNELDQDLSIVSVD